MAQFPIFNIDYLHCSAVKSAIKSTGTETPFENSPVENNAMKSVLVHSMISTDDSKYCILQRPTRKHI